MIHSKRSKIFLLVIDFAGYWALLNLVYYAFMGEWDKHYALTPLFFITIIALVVSFYIFNLYSSESGDSNFLWKFVSAFTIAVMGISSVVLLTTIRYQGGLAGRGILFASLIGFFIWSLLLRWGFFHFKYQRTRRDEWLFIGGADALRAILHDIRRHPFAGSVSLLVPSVRELKDETKKLDLTDQVEIGSWSSLEKKLNGRVKGIVVAQNTNLTSAMQRLLMKARIEGSRIYDLTDFYEIVWSAIPVLQLKEGWFVFSHGFNLLHNQTGLRVKRLIDLASAFVLLVLTLPLSIVTALAVFLESGRPVFYSQVRNGQSGRQFKVIKFRSMVVDAEKGGARWASPGDSRVTRVGRTIRKLRLDEIPQLINVIRGQMSFIGPRPERPEFDEKLEKIIPYYKLRYTLKPGLTGWAQVKYPYGASIEDAKEKLQYDLYYIKNYSIFLDFAIVLQTIRVVLHLKGR